MDAKSKKEVLDALEKEAKKLFEEGYPNAARVVSENAKKAVERIACNEPDNMPNCIDCTHCYPLRGVLNAGQFLCCTVFHDVESYGDWDKTVYAVTESGGCEAFEPKEGTNVID